MKVIKIEKLLVQYWKQYFFLRKNVFFNLCNKFYLFCNFFCFKSLFKGNFNFVLIKYFTAWWSAAKNIHKYSNN